MMVDDYAWALKVLNSCKTQGQIDISDRIFELFLKKWNNDIPESMKPVYISFFNKVKRTKVYESTKITNN